MKAWAETIRFDIRLVKKQIKLNGGLSLENGLALEEMIREHGQNEFAQRDLERYLETTDATLKDIRERWTKAWLDVDKFLYTVWMKAGIIVDDGRQREQRRHGGGDDDTRRSESPSTPSIRRREERRPRPHQRDRSCSRRRARSGERRYQSPPSGGRPHDRAQGRSHRQLREPRPHSSLRHRPRSHERDAYDEHDQLLDRQNRMHESHRDYGSPGARATHYHAQKSRVSKREHIPGLRSVAAGQVEGLRTEAHDMPVRPIGPPSRSSPLRRRSDSFPRTATDLEPRLQQRDCEEEPHGVQETSRTAERPRVPARYSRPESVASSHRGKRKRSPSVAPQETGLLQRAHVTDVDDEDVAARPDAHRDCISCDTAHLTLSTAKPKLSIREEFKKNVIVDGPLYVGPAAGE